MRRRCAWGSCRHLRVLCAPLRTPCFSSCMNLLFSNLQFQIRYRPPLASLGIIECDSRSHPALRAAAVRLVRASVMLRDHKLLSSVFSVNGALFARSFALSKMSTPVFSISCELFGKNTRVGGAPEISEETARHPRARRHPQRSPPRSAAAPTFAISACSSRCVRCITNFLLSTFDCRLPAAREIQNDVDTEARCTHNALFCSLQLRLDRTNYGKSRT